LEKGSCPQVLELEEAVQAMMIDKKGVDDVIDILSPDAFIKMLTNIFLRQSFSCLLKHSSSIY
jgi:replicative DNA helicase